MKQKYPHVQSMRYNKHYYSAVSKFFHNYWNKWDFFYMFRSTWSFLFYFLIFPLNFLLDTPHTHMVVSSLTTGVVNIFPYTLEYIILHHSCFLKGLHNFPLNDYTSIYWTIGVVHILSDKDEKVRHSRKQG